MKDLNIKTEKQLASFLNRYNKYVVKGIDENNCFKWNGAKTSSGYPVLSMGRVLGPVRVSRLILNLKNKNDLFGFRLSMTTHLAFNTISSFLYE